MRSSKHYDRDMENNTASATATRAQSRIFRIGEAKDYQDRAYSVFVKATYNGSRLSISGVEGPKRNGDAVGGCGQIDMHDWNIVNYAPGWDKQKETRLREIWKRWHLNDMRAECEHQQARGENWTNSPSATCPECGWKLGHGWLTEAVPADVLDELFSMPETDRQPAWV